MIFNLCVCSIHVFYVIFNVCVIFSLCVFAAFECVTSKDIYWLHMQSWVW